MSRKLTVRPWGDIARRSATRPTTIACIRLEYRLPRAGNLVLNHTRHYTESFH